MEISTLAIYAAVGYALIFYVYFYPKQFILTYRRYHLFSNDREVSETAIQVLRFVAVVGMVSYFLALVFAYFYTN